MLLGQKILQILNKAVANIYLNQFQSSVSKPEVVLIYCDCLQ